MRAAVPVEVLDEAAVRELEGRLAVVAGELNAAHGRLVGLVAEALEQGLWCQAGVTSPAHWLAWQAGLSPARARQVVQLAERAGELPVTAAALAAGELAVDQAVVVAATVPAWADAEACALAGQTTVAQARRVLGRYVFDDPTPAAEAPGASADPPVVDTCTFGGDEQGRFRLRAEGDADEGAIVEAALAEARDALVDAGRVDVSWWDALVEVAQRSLGTVSDPGRRDRYRLYLHVDGDGHGHQARFVSGGVVPTGLRRLIGCDATVQPVVWRAGRPLDVGRATRVVPGHLRRLVLHRDHHQCRVPGCTATRWLQVHHIVHWEHDGPTDLANLVAVCPAHHRLHHRGHLGITGNPDQPDGLVFTNQHGRPLVPTGRPTPPTGPPPPPEQPYHHPSGERLDTWSIYFNRPPV
jgi:hypothetical protein